MTNSSVFQVLRVMRGLIRGLIRVMYRPVGSPAASDRIPAVSRSALPGAVHAREPPQVAARVSRPAFPVEFRVARVPLAPLPATPLALPAVVVMANFRLRT